MSLRWTLCGVALSAACIAVAACAQGEGDIDLGFGDDRDGGMSPDGARLPPQGDGGRGGGGGTDADRPDDPDPDECPAPSGCSGKVVVNELMARGPGGAADEFVELYNPNTCAVSLGRWKLAYRSKTGTGNGVLHTFGAGATIAAGELLVLGTASFSPKDLTMNSGMADEGQVGLLDDKDAVIDAVGYGATSGPFIEGAAASGPPTNGSIGRTCGADTDDNGVDFSEYTQPTPGAPNP